MTQSIPQTMKAAAIDRFGGPEELHIEPLPVPQPAEDEVLIELDTAGIGVWDPYVREGEFRLAPPHFPQVIGNDGAGTVAAVGSAVQRFKPGDRVYAYTMKGGFYAEYVAVNEDEAAPVPPAMGIDEAGALGADGITAICGLLDQLQLQKDQTLMIFGASGGIGHIAVQLAKRIGARVFAVASGEDGVELVRRLGADIVIDGHRDEVAAHVFDTEGFDAALVLAGGAEVDEALKLVKKGGRIAYPNGVEPVPNAPDGTSSSAYDGAPSADAFERLNQLIGSEPFHVQLARVYPLEDASTAHRELEKHFVGKLALKVH